MKIQSRKAHLTLLVFLPFFIAKLIAIIYASFQKIGFPFMQDWRATTRYVVTITEKENMKTI